MTAYTKLLQYQKNQKDTKNKEIATDLTENVLGVLKNAYIGDVDRSHKEKMDSLYPDERNALKICLDLGSSRSIGKMYVDSIRNEKFSNFEFESSLSYVSLPPRKQAGISGGRPDRSDVLDTYKPIFDFLKKKGVKRIFRIAVNDLVGTPHSDQSIVELTKGLNIEHWEWNKLDMNSDTILEAAPNVKTLMLHSSGNFSALQGWSCKHGLAKLQHLKKIKVILHTDRESDTSLKAYRDIFATRLKRRFEKNRKDIELEINFQHAAPYGTEYLHNQRHHIADGRSQKNHDWLNHIHRFTEGIRNFDFRAHAPTVKVALIDDGIDPEKTRFPVHDGRTFNEKGDTGLDHYFVDPGEHGTVMGRLISKMCPNVQLYVARITKSLDSDIPAAAAKEAIGWALKKDVDIISMSWTIPSKGSNTQDTKAFQDAVADATRKNKLLFCALRESEDSLIEQDFYPVGLESVFKIGSATRSGNQVNIYSGDRKTVQFILPGREVLIDDEGGVKTLSGSSVATALAAGLAGLILLCADLVDQDMLDSDTPSNHGPNLRDISRMKSVFEHMSRKSNDGKFPEVQKYFKITGKDPTIEDLKALVNSLMAGL